MNNKDRIGISKNLCHLNFNYKNYKIQKKGQQVTL